MKTHLPLALLVAASFAFTACGGDVAPQRPTPTWWHTEARHVEARLLPARSHPDLASIALPEVTWTGIRPEPTSATRLAVGVYADGTVSLGEIRLPIRAVEAEEGVSELRARWEAERGVLARLVPPDEVPRVEVYADRAASWEHVRSVLLFLALPPHGFVECRFVVARNDPREMPIHVLARLGQTGWSHRRWEGPDWQSLLDRLPPLWTGPDPAEDEYVWRARYRGFLLGGGGRAEEPDVLSVDGEVVTTPARLDDERVVARANEVWAAWAQDTVWRLRRYRGMVVHVAPGGGRYAAGGSTARDLVPVPAAYPVQLVDLAHVDGLGVRTELVPGVFLSLDPPPAFARPPPDEALPVGVAGLCLLAAALAVASVFAGASVTRRPRVDQPTDAS